jgi:HEAT repeat protein
LILDKISHAVSRIGKDKKVLVDQFFKLLISLPRPVPIIYLSEIMRVDIDFLKDLSSDIWNGLILEEDLFSFRDEDFENYIRETYQITLDELQQITQIFLSKSEEDEYASINLGSLLFTAEYKKELVDIVLKRKLLTFPKDPIRNKEVYINRAKLALKVSNDIHDDLTYFKLLFIAAEESKTDKALSELLIDYPDLVSRFGDEVSLSRLKLKSEEKPWAGAFHLKLAGIYSRKPESKEIALKHLKTAREWLNWRSQKKKEELRDYPISSLDIAYEVETILRLFGLAKAIEAINRWTPSEVRLSAGNYLIENIISFSTKGNIDEWLKHSNFRIDVKLFIVCKLFQYNQPINFDLKVIAFHLSDVLSKKQVKFGKQFWQLISRFCGVLVHHNIDAKTISDILSSINTKPLDKIPFFYNSYSDAKEEIAMDMTLAKETLVFSLKNEQADIEYFYPDKFKDIDKIEDYEKRNSLESDKKEFASFYKYAIPIYQLRSDLLAGRVSQSDCLAKFHKICSSIEKDYDFKYQNGHWSNDRLIFFAGKLTEITFLLEDKTKLIDLIISSFDSQTSKLRLRFEILEKIILLKDLLKTSLKLLGDSDKIIKDSDLSAKEATDNYIKCLLFSSKIDNSFSKYFFDEAIKATSEIDYEAFAQIRSIYYLSEMGIAKPNAHLAYEYARFIEYCDIKLGSYDKKHFPYTEGLIGVANIDMPSMLATVCRWHHRNISEIDVKIVSLIKLGFEKGYFDHTVAAALLPLKTNYRYEELEELYKRLIQKFESGDSELNNRFLQAEFRDLRLQKDKHFTRKIYDEIELGKLMKSDVLSEIKNYLDFLETLEDEKSNKEINHFKKETILHNIDLTELDYTSTKEIEKAIDVIILNNADSYNHRWNIENFLSDILDKCSPNEYTQFLNALVDVSDNLLDFHSFETTVEKAINEWTYYPEVKTWKQEKFKYILLTKLPHFDYGNSLSIWSIKRFAELFSIDDSRLADIMLEILPQKIDLLSDESLYSSFELIKTKLSASDNEVLLVWVLQRWNSKIKPEIADGNWVEELAPPINTAENVACLLRFILGHPDKKLRWRAVHSIRRLVKLDNVEILKALLDNQNKKDCLPFQNKGYIYYWMSAKLYLWIAIDRISIENPDALLPFKDVFYNELMSQELPHVLIKHYIKKACLNLYDFDNAIYSASELQNIQEVNKSKLGYVEEKKYSRKQRKYSTKSKKEWRFRFDGMDTLPYWYNRVGDAFNLSEYDVADVADKFITEKWGYTGNPHKDDFIRGQLYDRDWHKTSHRHGSNPEVESLSIYFEYHAMYCAANFLLENEPLAEADTAWYSWENWLNSEANAFDSFWLSDLRDPLPLKPKYWKNDIDKFDKIWRNTIADECFDESVGFLNDEEDRFLNIYGGLTKNVGANQETITIRSCLVSNKGADALLRAFQTTKDSHDYSIPFDEEDEEEYDKATIVENGFSLTGWVVDIRSEFEGLDSDDTYFNGTSKGYIKFGKTVHGHFNIEYDNLYKQGYLDNRSISLIENWNEISDEEYRYKKYNTAIETSGCIFRVDSQFILSVLKAEQKSLIVKCVIDRQLEERKYRERYDDNRKCVKLYLIKPDGTVKTLRGRNYKIG